MSWYVYAWNAEGQRLYNYDRVRAQVTSRQETYSSAHLDKQSKQRHVSSNSPFDLNNPKALYRCFRKQHGCMLCLHYSGTRRTYWAVQGGVFVRGADWLSSSVIQIMAKGHLTGNMCTH